MKRRIARTFIAALMAASALTGVAYAQDRRGGEEEVIVTAQKRAQAAQDVGIAITALSGAVLTEKGITNINGLENVAPSLEVEKQFGSGQVSFSLRGVGFKDYASNNAPTVGVYVDEVAYPYPIMTQGVLFDVQRVEVLRGPQGTLYGRNTTGGAVNIISNKPQDTFGWGVTSELSNFGKLSGESYITGALSKAVRARLAVAGEWGGNWQKNRETREKLGDADKVAGRLLVDFGTSDAFNVLINLHGFEDKSDGLGLQLFKPFGATPAHSGSRSTSWGSSAEFAVFNGIAVDTAPFRENTGYGASATVNWNVGPGTLTYIGAYEYLRRKEFNDYDAVPAGIAGVMFRSKIGVQSHELRFASDYSGPFNWVGGLYYSEEELKEIYASDFAASFGPGFGSVRTPYRQNVETRGVFAQGDLALSDRVKLVAGVRYEDEDRGISQFGTFAGAFGPLNLVTCTGGFGVACTTSLVSRSTGMNEWSGKLGLEFRQTDELLWYANVSRGVKSGGFTAYNSLAPEFILPFRPEVLIAYEAGWKSEFANRRVRLNGAAFYYDYEDQQVQGAGATGGFLIGTLFNVPKSRIYGAELDLLWRPSEAVTIGQTVGYQNGEFREGRIINTAAPGTRALKGERLGPPELTYSGSFAYDGALGATGFNWRGVVDYSYRSDTDPPLLKAPSGAGYGVDAYWLANLTLAFYKEGRPWEIAAWGRNIFDEKYDETRNFFAAPDFTPVAAPGMPATYGLRLKVAY
jgi:outer membrane receptor protein involved in Fe transport